MPNKQELSDLKDQIKASIRHNSSRGFVPYSGCNRVCAEMQAVMNVAEQHSQVTDYQQAFDIYIMVLLETLRLVSHADDSSGCAGDVIYTCLFEIDKLCKIVAENTDKHFFDTLIKTAKSKALNGWDEWTYELLTTAVCFVNNEKQAKKIYDIFSTLGKRYGGQKNPDEMLIIHGIIERLQGKEEANKYVMSNLDLPEFRKVAVEAAIANKEFDFAEKLCSEALSKDIRSIYHKPSEWAYFLEQIYEETNNTEALRLIVRSILTKGDTSYFIKLKSLYEQQDVWEEERMPLWQELSKKIGIQYYTTLLSQEGELELLLNEVKQHKSYISDYGKQLAAEYSDEVYKIYEEYIIDEAKQATDRGKYKKVCYIIKSLAGAGGKIQAIELIERLYEMYPRRPAMLDELAGLKKKLSK